MADDDSIDDDVFETKDATAAERLNVDESVPTTTPSPTGYRDYKPPAEVLRLCQTDAADNAEELEQTVHKVLENNATKCNGPKRTNHVILLKRKKKRNRFPLVGIVVVLV